MRQPVASVLALAGAALAEPSLPTAVRAQLEQIVQHAEWLADMIQVWLQAAAPGEPGSRTDLVWVISEAVAAARATSPVPVTVRMVGPVEAVHTSVDPVIFRRIIANVLSSAALAAGSSDNVTIEIGSQDGRALIVVSGSGPSFGRLQEGLMPGLRAVADNVVSYGGRLECGRGSLGGAQVSLWLPLAA